MPSSSSEMPLLPYPSDAHLVDAWSMVLSLLGRDNKSPMIVDSSTTELKLSCNFIFQVDGQVMGGPVLDDENGHNAAEQYYDVVDKQN